MKKPTVLEQYLKIRQEFQQAHTENMPTPNELWKFQELMYRIDTLQSLRQFILAAPFSTELKTLVIHYKVVDAYVENLKSERAFPAAPSQEAQKQRETALNYFFSVINDYRNRYNSYMPQGPEQYPKDISHTLATVLPAWVQYRNTINEIKIPEEA